MRTLMTLTTLGAAGVGYAYIQQAPAVGEASVSAATASRRYDWSRDVALKGDDERVPVSDLVGRIRERTKSVLDDFARQQGGHSDSPVDDAFQRLRQVAQSAVSSAVNPVDVPKAVENGGLRAAERSRPNWHELQRIAFDPNDTETGTVVRDAALPNRTETTADASAPVLKPSISHSGPAQSELANSDESRVPNPTESALGRATTSSVSRTIAPVSPKSSNDKSLSKRDLARLAAEWKIVGKTSEGRPMHTMHLGDRGTRTLVIAGLNGDDRTAVRWLEQLAEESKRRPELFENNEVVFFRAGNPDGLVRNVRTNAARCPVESEFSESPLSSDGGCSTICGPRQRSGNARDSGYALRLSTATSHSFDRDDRPFAGTVQSAGEELVG